MTYSVMIQLLDEIEYKGIFSLANGKIYIRTLIDEREYEDMFWELIEEGYTEVQSKYTHEEILKFHEDENFEKLNESDKYDFKHIDFENDLLKIFEKIKSLDIDVEYEEIEDDKYVFSLVADGHDMNPEVIAHLGKGTKIIRLAESVYRCSNNIKYEPKMNIRASSYAVDVQANTNNDEATRQLINSINSEKVDVDEYFSNQEYARVIDSLIEIATLHTLKTLKAEFLAGDDLNIDLDSVRAIKRNYKTMMESRPFNHICLANGCLRAFDDTNFTLKMNSDKVYHLHLRNEKLYNEIKKHHKENNKISIHGRYKSKQTIDVFRVVLVTSS